MEQAEETKKYDPLPTLLEFHEDPAQMRCIVGPVGSGKTTGVAWELFYYLPQFLFDNYGYLRTRWVIVRNTYAELIDTTQKTVFEWFDWGNYKTQQKDYEIRYPNGMVVEALFRSCDRPEDVKKFKSLEITGYWIDESIEVDDTIKKMLKNRIGRYPSVRMATAWYKKKFRRFPKTWFKNGKLRPVLPRFGMETTNPPDVEHPTYTDFRWNRPPPGPIPEGEPLKNHAGFWQPPGENENNLRAGYYDQLREDYEGNADWIETYIEGKPGVIITGKLVYNNFVRDRHVAKAPLVWSRGPLYRGWDNSGNTPACIVVQVPTATHVQVLAEFHTARMNIVDFTRYVVSECNLRYPNAKFTEWGDPAGANTFSTKDGGFTSNSKLQEDESGIKVMSSEQNWIARVESVDQSLGRYDGLLIDPGCTRLINGFIGGYCLPQIALTGMYQNKPNKLNKFTHIHDALQYVMVKIVKGVFDSEIFRPDRGKRSRPAVRRGIRRRAAM